MIKKEIHALNRSSLKPRRQLLDGTTRVFLAEALILPTGMVILIFLTRKLGPEGFGLFTLAAAFIFWLETIIGSIFSGATVKFVSEATDWRSVGNTVIRLHLAIGAGTALLLLFSADAISSLLNEPALARYLQIFALDIPLFSLARAQRSVLIGRGAFGQRGLMSAGRYITRLIVIVLLVELGLSVSGAIIASIVASLVEYLIGRSNNFNLSPFRRSSFLARRLFGYAVWLFLFSISILIYKKLDLFMLKILGGTANQAGIYGAAQNLSFIPVMFAFAFAPLLLSTLSRMLRAGKDRESRELGGDTMRAVFWLLPFAAMTAGASQEIIVLILGRPYVSAALPMALLIFAALSMVMIAVTTSILTAAGKPGWTFAMTGPLIPLALLGHILLIPRWGLVGASLSTTLTAIVGALATMIAVYGIWRVRPRRKMGTFVQNV